MAGVKCQSCDTHNPDGETFCCVCGSVLGEDSRAQDPPSPADRPAPEPAAAKPAQSTCPACGADVPDPANLVCVECLELLSPSPDATAAAAGSGSGVRGSGHKVVALRLLFAGQPIDVPRAGSLLLGRDADHSQMASFFATRDNVSRRHASVGVEPDGTAWVRDEYSLNGTFVNDKRVPSGRTVSLVDGDRLRIASDIVARVELGGAGSARTQQPPA